MDGPQACSRWARQPQPQLRHFKKPLVGPLPSPSNHSGRSEAPENSETSPREKGNLGLPVLLTDGSTHLEQIVGSDRAALSQRTVFCGVKSGAWRPADAQDASVRGGGGGKGHWCRRFVQHNTGVLRVTVLSDDSAAPFFSIWSLEVGGRGGYILMCPFFLGRWCEGKHGCVGGGASAEIRKWESSYIQPLA